MTFYNLLLAVFGVTTIDQGEVNHREIDVFKKSGAELISFVENLLTMKVIFLHTCHNFTDFLIQYCKSDLLQSLISKDVFLLTTFMAKSPALENTCQHKLQYSGLLLDVSSLTSVAFGRAASVGFLGALSYPQYPFSSSLASSYNK